MFNFKINSINNSLSNHHQSFSKNNIHDDSDFHKFSDRELYGIASYVPDKKMSHVTKNAINTLLIAVPVIDIALAALTKKGALSSKVKSSAIVSTFWAVAFASSFAVSKAKKTVNNNSKLLDDFNKKHRLLSTIVDFSVMLGVFNGVLNGFHKIISVANEKMPEQAKILHNKVVKPFTRFLNESIVNRKIVEPFENYLEKNPIAAKAIKTTARLTVPTVILATVLRFAVELNKRNENVENNFYILKAINQNYVHQTDEDKIA